MRIGFPSFLKKYFSDEEIDLLRKKKLLQIDHYKSFNFVRLTSDFKKRYPRGTIFYEDAFIPGYRRIMRILSLKNGINRYFKKERFYVEEKMDGYNVRIVMIDGKLLTFTRGGFVCPFTTNRISEFIDLKFFKENIGFIIGGEVVGPGSPYNVEDVPYIKDDITFFAFDIFDNTSRILSVEERYEILEKYKIPQIRRWGPFSSDEIDKVKEIVLQLNRENREGVVIKSILNEKAIKYVTLSSCLKDLQATAGLITEIPAGFYIQRIIRAIFFCHEFGIPLNEQYLMEAAKALYLIPANVLSQIEKGGSLIENFEVNIREDKEVIYELIDHFNKADVNSKLLSIEKNNNLYKARFQKIYTKGTKELRRKLNGHGFFD